MIDPEDLRLGMAFTVHFRVTGVSPYCFSKGSFRFGVDFLPMPGDLAFLIKPTENTPAPRSLPAAIPAVDTR